MCKKGRFVVFRQGYRQFAAASGIPFYQQVVRRLLNKTLGLYEIGVVEHISPEWFQILHCVGEIEFTMGFPVNSPYQENL